MLMSRRALLGCAAAFAGVPALRTATAQHRPSRPIKILASYPPGGLVDLVARAYGEHLSLRLERPVVVENRPGASGIIAARAMLQAPRDGYTLMFTLSSALISNRILFKSLPYDPDRDFAFISSMTTGQLPLVVQTSTGVKNLAELASYARDNPVNFGTFGSGTYGHIVAVELNRLLGIKMEPVHYRGEAPMWRDLAAGVIQCATGTFPGAYNLIQSGSGQAVAVSNVRRMSRLPDVPTYSEQGLTSKAFRLNTFICLVGPSEMPPGDVETLSKLMVEGGKTEQVQKILHTFGIEQAAIGHKAFKSLLAEETGPWLALVRSLNLAPQG